MIKIKICYIQNEFKSIEVKGHANAAPYGQDIVCSGVSAVVFGGLANINCEENYTYEIDEEKGYFYIESNGKNSEHDKVVLETIITSLRKIENEYPKNVHIDEQEMKGNN